MPSLAVPLLSLVLAATPAPAPKRPAAPPPPPEPAAVLVSAPTPLEMRVRLLGLAREAAASRPAAAGEAWYWVGRLHERAGEPDSAAASYRRALELRGAHEERLALADLLLQRRAAGDVAEARALLGAARGQLQMALPQLETEYDARLAWAAHLEGRSDSALLAFRGLEPRIAGRPEWRYRIAVAQIGARDLRRAFATLMPLAVASRKHDADVMARLREIADATEVASRLMGEIDRAIAATDRVDAVTLERMQAQRISFAAPDGFPLSGAVVMPAAPAGRRTHGAVVLVAPGDTIADYDTLAVALARAGHATLFLDLRCSGRSVGPSCPLPDRRAGREDELLELGARDVSAAFDALRRGVTLDTTRMLVVGVGATAPIAVRAAERDPRVAALLLVSPRPAMVERGPMKAVLERLQMPVYFQSGPEDYDYAAFTESLYQSGNRGASRVAEARWVGHGVRQFYFDPAVGERFTRWLGETLKHARRRSPPPASRRSG